MSVPNIFHFVFGLRKQTEPFHLCHYLAIESCARVNGPDAIYLHYHHEPWGEYWDRVRHRVRLERVELVRRVARHRYGWRNRDCKRYAYAHHADFIRLDALIERGGVYADIDTIFVNPIPAELRERDMVLGREDDIVDQTTGETKRSLCNALIMCAPGAEFAVRWRASLDGAFDGSWSGHSTLLPQRLAEEDPQLVHIEPARSFYPHMWTREGLHTLLEGCDPDFAGIYSMHLWSHLWWEEGRRDFSDFHAGLLTEDYVRNVATTYGLVARRFLA
ncbi:MAG TPA: glycosyltransferase [Thermoanaerobaculaceae bacterium]|nr:glycosyltransferase [Thermoanaerobaculaceae bacterium]HQU33371.1 glycosyltransferase [Thermoanaerobaculaceae bacterium]